MLADYLQEGCRPLNVGLSSQAASAPWGRTWEGLPGPDQGRKRVSEQNTWFRPGSSHLGANQGPSMGRRCACHSAPRAAQTEPAMPGWPWKAPKGSPVNNARGRRGWSQHSHVLSPGRVPQVSGVKPHRPGLDLWYASSTSSLLPLYDDHMDEQLGDFRRNMQK